MGSLLTGFLFDSLGARWSFRVYGISALVFLVISVVLHSTCLKEGAAEERDNVIVKAPHLDSKPHGMCTLRVESAWQSVNRDRGE